MDQRTGGSAWAAWDRFVEATPASGFMQASWWAEFRLSAGFRHFGSVVKSDGDIVGGAIVLKMSVEPGECFYYIQDGPVLPDDEEAAAEIFGALMADIDRHRAAEPDTVSHLRIEPRWERLPDFVRGFRAPDVRDGYVEPRTTLCIDLRPPEPEILARMKPKGRYNIRLAERSGVTIVEDASDRGVDDFIDLYEDTAVRQHFSAKPPDYFTDLVTALVDARRGSVFFAEYGGERLAGAIVVWCGNRATYFFGASDTRDRHVMAPYLLHWEMMRHAKARGLTWYDFWGVAPPGMTDHPWSDISTFKRKFGGVEVALVPTMDLVFDERAYRRYTNAVTDRTAAPQELVPAG